MHCIMLNIQSLCGWRRVRSSPGGQGVWAAKGQRQKAEWGVGYRKTRRVPLSGCVRGWSSWIPWEQIQRKSFLCIPFPSPQLQAFNTSESKRGDDLWRKKYRGFFPFCSVFWNCPHLLVKAVTQGSSFAWKSLFLAASMSSAAQLGWAPRWSLLAP